jgi:hypothetical protein
MVAWVAVSFFAALLGRTEEAQQARERAERLQVELATADAAATLTFILGEAALACGRATEAGELLARACTVHETTGAVGLLCTDAALYAHALLLVGDHRSARRQVHRAIETGSSDDVLTQGLARSALAWLAAVDGEDPLVVRRHMTDALAALEPTQFLIALALTHCACAEAALLIGDHSGARHHRQSAIDLYDAKENVVGAAVQRALL